MRKLATIRKISSIQPIKGKDRVEMAIVDGWTCMVSKADNFKPEDLCIFCEPDSVFPKIEQWKFLEKYNYRIKTQKFKDSDGNPVYSQGLVLPMRILEKKYDLGDDVTEELGITQYEPPMDNDKEVTSNKKDGWFIRLIKNSFLMRYAWMRYLVLTTKKDIGFPKFVAKTDEERIQNCHEIVNIDDNWVATEKIDGQSGTWCLKRIKRKILPDKYEFIVCSRNLRTYGKDTSYWRIAEKYDIENALKRYMTVFSECDWVCIQGEIIGPKIQGNKYKVSDVDMYVFNLIDSICGRCKSITAKELVSYLGMKFVPIIEDNVNLRGFSVQQILEMSNGKSRLANTKREGIVFRSKTTNKSFKAISPEFLIENNE